MKKEQINPRRWGLKISAVEKLADQLFEFWKKYRVYFVNQTRDPSEYAYIYLRGMLTMESERTFANIARNMINHTDSGQNLQQFISDSPWDSGSLFEQIQKDIAVCPNLQGGLLTLDDSGDEKDGEQSAGAAPQYLGRHGKIEMSQNGVALGYYKDGFWNMVDAQLYLPRKWFTKEKKSLWKELHIPKDKTFQTKIEIGWDLIQKAKQNGLPFSAVSCDGFYGQSDSLRSKMNKEGIQYLCGISNDTHVYLEKPVVAIPQTPALHRGPPFSEPRVLSDHKTISVRDFAKREKITFRKIFIRHAERGKLYYNCYACRVWTFTKDRDLLEEWLLIQQEEDGTLKFSLSNAPINTSLTKLAKWKAGRYFAERIFQEAKSDIGWDELVGRKYRSWMHHTALTALAMLFILQVKLEWRKKYKMDPRLAKELDVEVLPALSIANIRDLLRSVLPLRQLSPLQAIESVSIHLANRAKSTSIRLKKQKSHSIYLFDIRTQ